MESIKTQERFLKSELEGAMLRKAAFIMPAVAFLPVTSSAQMPSVAG